MENERTCNLLSCFCICFLFTGVLNQYSLSPGPVVYVINGRNVTFTCSITKSWNVTYVFDHGIKDSNLARVIFQRNNTHCRPVYIDTQFGSDKYFALPCNVGQPVSFIVRYITASYHNKSISCKVDAGQLISTTVKIREKITTPKIDPAGIRTVEEGTYVSFRCTATSIPKSSIVWYVNGTKLTSSVTTASSAENNMISTISYLAEKEHYNMNLFCSANDSFTTMDSLSAILNILYVPTVRIEPEYNPYIIYAGQQNVILTCVVDAANPPDGITYHWTNVGGTVNNNTVVISTVANADSGQYTCIAESRVGNSTVISIHLTVQYGPFVSNITYQDVTEGNDIIVSPKINADPAARLVWWSTKIDQNFRYNGAILKINNIHRTSSGYYTCHVINTLTPSGMTAINMTTEKSVYVNVQFKPSLDYTRPYSPSHITAIENINLVITVTLVANPTPTIEWTFKEEADLNSCNFSTIFSNTTTDGFRSTTSIAIGHVQSGNLGEYVLIARSTVGIFSRRFVVNTEGETNLPTLSYVICKSTSATVIWQHVFNGGSSLDFYIQFAEKGQYVKTEILQLNNTIQPMIYEVTALKPNSRYNFSIIAVNVLVEFKSQTLECLTDASCLQQEMFELRSEHTSMFVAGIATLVIGLLSLTTAVIFIVRTNFKIKTCQSSKSDEYTEVNRSNPAVTDSYTPLQSDIESRPSQEQSVNTYEECRRQSEAHAYISLGTMESEQGQVQEQTVKTYEECRSKSEAHAYDTLGKLESEPRQNQTVNTYEECRSTSEAHAYDTLGKVESEPRQAQVQSVNTYEECRSTSEAHAYDTLGKLESGQKDSQKKQGVYDNLKI